MRRDAIFKAVQKHVDHYLVDRGNKVYYS